MLPCYCCTRFYALRSTTENPALNYRIVVAVFQVEEEVRKLEDAGVPRDGVFVGGESFFFFFCFIAAVTAVTAAAAAAKRLWDCVEASSAVRCDVLNVVWCAQPYCVAPRDSRSLTLSIHDRCCNKKNATKYKVLCTTYYWL